jgi:hypothetical protein
MSILRERKDSLGSFVLEYFFNANPFGEYSMPKPTVGQLMPLLGSRNPPFETCWYSPLILIAHEEENCHRKPTPNAKYALTGKLYELLVGFFIGSLGFDKKAAQWKLWDKN